MKKKEAQTPLNSNRLRVGLYVRVSTIEQAEEGYSISVQTEKLKSYCFARGWDISFTYTDPGFSGSNMNRPALQKMFNDIKNGNLDIVLVYKLDRLSRSQRDTLYMIEDIFLKNGIDFVSMTENFDTSTPLGRAMIGILSVFAQLEREQIKERMTMGNIARASSGLWRGGSGVPIGYDYINGQLVINKYEAMQIQFIFDLFLKGYTFHGIQKELQKRNYTNKYGSWKNASIISKVLQNTTYIGMVRYAGEEYTGQHEAIINLDIWRAVQNRLKEVLRGLSDHQKSPFKASKLLTGLIWCGDCGARYFFHSVKHKNAAGDSVYYEYYECYTRAAHKTMRRAKHCKGKTWRQEDLDNLVISEIKKLAFSETSIEELVQKKPENLKISNRLETIQEHLEELEKQLNKTMDLYTLGNIPFDIISQKAATISKEREALIVELNSLEPSTPVLGIDEAKQLLKMVDTVFDKGTIEEQRVLVNALIEKIILQSDKSVDIYWKFT